MIIPPELKWHLEIIEGGKELPNIFLARARIFHYLLLEGIGVPYQGNVMGVIVRAVLGTSHMQKTFQCDLNLHLQGGHSETILLIYNLEPSH